MTSSIDRIENLFKVIDEYERIFHGVKRNIENARKSNKLADSALSIMNMFNESTLSPETIEILAVERAMYRINAPKARYRQRKRREKIEKLSPNNLEGYKEFNSEKIQQDLNDFNPEDDI